MARDHIIGIAVHRTESPPCDVACAVIQVSEHFIVEVAGVMQDVHRD